MKLTEREAFESHELIEPLWPVWQLACAWQRSIDAHPDHSGDGGDAVDVAIALEQQRALSIVQAVREQGFAKSGSAMPTQAESVFDLACEEIEHRLRTEVWELKGISAPVPQDGDERARFEAWANSNGFGPKYRESMFAAWQAALASNKAAAVAVGEPTLFRWKTSWDGWTYRDERPAGWRDLGSLEAYARVATHSAPIASASEALYTMDQMREYADNFHLSRMRVLVAEKEAYERHAPKPEPYGYAPIHENGNYFTRNKSTADYVGGMMPVYAVAQPSKAEVLEEAAQWQWRWIGDTDDAWRNSTQAECERIAGFAPEKQHWEVRALYAHPAAIRSQDQS